MALSVSRLEDCERVLVFSESSSFTFDPVELI